MLYEDQVKQADAPTPVPDVITHEVFVDMQQRIEHLMRMVDQLFELMGQHEHSRVVAPEVVAKSRDVGR